MKFPSGTTADLLKLIAEHPLAWIVSSSESGFAATPLPLLAETGPDGELAALLGHCSRTSVHKKRLEADPRAVILFTGPHGYISPELVSRAHWVPTWNYGVAVIQADIEFVSDETPGAVEELVDHMEAGRAAPWTMSDAGDRVDSLMTRIIAFRAHVRSVDARFKLGQEEGADIAAEIINGVPDPILSGWMRHFNADRIADGTGAFQSQDSL